MRNDFYPTGSVEALLHSDAVNPQTVAVLNERLQSVRRIAPAIFEESIFSLLEAVGDCLFPQGNKSKKIPLAILFEKNLATGKGKGWRYNGMPSIMPAMLQGLNAIEAETHHLYQANFSRLPQQQKEAVMTIIQKGKTTSPAWKGLPSALFFEELLALLTELYYSHPFAKEEIGEVAFADKGGWQNIGLNKLENREPRPLNSQSDAAL